jgi:hypothetical protein
MDLRERKTGMENIKYENPDNLYPQRAFGRVMTAGERGINTH